MGAGIGFGKAGNNPYQWLALGGAGLQSMLAGSQTNDPGSLQNDQFLRAAAASGQPQTSIPRDVHGLLPMLAQRIGLISPNIQASPDQMNMEKIFLAAKQQADQKEKLTEMVKFLDVVNSSMKYGPAYASKVYAAFPSMETPGITPQDIAGLTTPQEDKLAQQEQHFQESQNLKEQGINLREEGLNIQQQRLADQEAKGGTGGEADRRARFGQYQAMLRARLRNPMTGEIDPAAQKAYDNALRIQNSGGEVSDAIQENEAILNPPQAPTPVSQPSPVIEGLKAILSRVVGATPTMGSAPTGMQPQARPTVVPKVVPSW